MAILNFAYCNNLSDVSENLMALFGSQYVASSNILVILTIATFFQAVFGVAAPTLSMTGHTKLVLYNTLSVFVINLY